MYSVYVGSGGNWMLQVGVVCVHGITGYWILKPHSWMPAWKQGWSTHRFIKGLVRQTIKIAVGISWFETYDAQTLSYLQYIWHHLALKSTHAPIFWPLRLRKRHRNNYQHVPYSPSPIVPNIQGSASASILIPFSNSAAKWNGRFGCFLSEKLMQASLCIIPRLNPSQIACWMVVTCILVMNSSEDIQRFLISWTNVETLLNLRLQLIS